MRIKDLFNSKAIAIEQTQVASNNIPYLGEGFFPSQKKEGLDLKWIKTSKGLPVSLNPSAFDTVSALRSREGFKQENTQMAYFKESMLVKEEDRQEMLRVKESSDPYASQVLANVFDDANTLIAGAKVVPERMRMSLLANANGKPSISFSANGSTYAYDYDPNGDYARDNFLNVGVNDSDLYWDGSDADPVADVSYGLDAVEALTGTRPEIMIVSRKTMNQLKANAKVRSYILAQNSTANVMVTDERVKAVFSQELGVNIVVYTKLYKDETGTTKKFYPDGMATLVPAGALGKTWFGTTPEMATLLEDANYDCTVIDNISVTVVNSVDPVQTKTIVSEICLPSFERANETFMLKVNSSVAY